MTEIAWIKSFIFHDAFIIYNSELREEDDDLSDENGKAYQIQIEVLMTILAALRKKLNNALRDIQLVAKALGN